MTWASHCYSSRSQDSQEVIYEHRPGGLDALGPRSQAQSQAKSESVRGLCQCLPSHFFHILHLVLVWIPSASYIPYGLPPFSYSMPSIPVPVRLFISIFHPYGLPTNPNPSNSQISIPRTHGFVLDEEGIVEMDTG
ncbi:hypothetical protein BT96DRAFT_348429 [Gymnopus androsaceus JB14]|uniref:Uncharacterized protein n=1 Tax=Gymnopus androsaceus JB14 TaxID=1447944 RepID=A0A6A4I3G9_9AGAR|nr:hypothetical protein BT96DRAFT_348429 [Gymnopus androsaceus JB14]